MSKSDILETRPLHVQPRSESTSPPHVYFSHSRSTANNTKVPHFLSMLTEFESLRSLTLLSPETLDEGNIGNTNDPNYDAARGIMVYLHSRKAGHAFDLLQIWVWVPAPYSDEERLFASRISEVGVYEQWGSERWVIPDLILGDVAQGEIGEDA